MAWGANKQPEEQDEIDDGQHIAVDERRRQACAEHRRDAPVNQGEVGPGEIVTTTGQDEGGGQERRNCQEDHSATGEQMAKAHVLKKEAGGCRHQRQLPEGDELQPEDLGVGVDGRRLEHGPDGPGHGEQAGDGEGQRRTHGAMTPSIPSQGSDQHRRDDRWPEIATIDIG